MEGSRNSLYIPYPTWACAKRGCVCCAYKIVVTRPDLKHSGKGFPPNQRPENCLRIQSYAHPVSSSFGLYENINQRILSVGDGDLSFALSLAKRLGKTSVTGSTYLSSSEFYQVYENAKEILEEARLYSNLQVLHSVDATELGRKRTPLSSKKDEYFHKVVWNFPCVAPTQTINSKESARDGQNQEMEMNKELLAHFFKRVHRVCVPGGEIHIIHKTKPPYSHWGIIDIAEKSGLLYRSSVVFDKSLYPGYKNRKARKGKGSFPCHDARVFIFTIPLIRTISVSKSMGRMGVGKDTHQTQTHEKAKFKKCKRKILRRVLEMFAVDDHASKKRKKSFSPPSSKHMSGNQLGSCVRKNKPASLQESKRGEPRSKYKKRKTESK